SADLRKRDKALCFQVDCRFVDFATIAHYCHRLTRKRCSRRPDPYRSLRGLLEPYVVESSGRGQLAGTFEDSFHLFIFRRLQAVEWMCCRLSGSKRRSENESNELTHSHGTILLTSIENCAPDAASLRRLWRPWRR